MQITPFGPNYSKTVELPPLRGSFEDLQAMLDKISSLVKAANKGSSSWQEELHLRKGEQTIKMSGHRLVSEAVKIPPSIDSFDYTGRIAYTGRDREETNPINQVAISLHDYGRSISVEGQSPEQVDAVVSALQGDLSKFSISFGNFGKTFLTWPGRLFGPILFLGWVLFLIWVIWVQTRRRILVVPAAICVVLLIALLILPLDELFAGFSAVRGEASLLVRYGPEITLCSLVLSLLGLVVPTAISLLGARVSK